jgi:hypothetical protein
MCAKLSVEFDVELKWSFGVQLNGSLVGVVGVVKDNHHQWSLRA